MTKKANDAVLGELHGIVAEVLKMRLRAPLFHEGEAVPDTTGLGCSASELAVAVTFLKNNNITADPETNKALSDLREKLKESRDSGKAKLTRQSVQEAAAMLERDLGGTDILQ
jgi:hypothetical protein